MVRAEAVDEARWAGEHKKNDRGNERDELAGAQDARGPSNRGPKAQSQYIRLVWADSLAPPSAWNLSISLLRAVRFSDRDGVCLPHGWSIVVRHLAALPSKRLTLYESDGGLDGDISRPTLARSGPSHGIPPRLARMSSALCTAAERKTRLMGR